jgi:hypothetical protein
MSDWIGHSVVAGIASLVIFSAIAVKSRVDEVVVATIQTRAAKKSTLDTAAMLERDIRNVGSNFPAYELDPDSVMIYWETDSTVNFFQWVGQAEPGQPPAIIRYQWQVVDSSVVNGEMTPLYRVSRFINGTLYAHSPSTFTHVSLQPLNDTGEEAASADEMRQVKIELKGISSLGSPDMIRETRWNAVYRPQALALKDDDEV